MKSILLIGVNHFGAMIAKQLHDLGHEVMAVDRNEDRINAILPIVTDAQIGDSTNEAFLKSLGIKGLPFLKPLNAFTGSCLSFLKTIILSL